MNLCSLRKNESKETKMMMIVKTSSRDDVTRISYVNNGLSEVAQCPLLKTVTCVMRWKSTTVPRLGQLFAAAWLATKPISRAGSSSSNKITSSKRSLCIRSWKLNWKFLAPTGAQEMAISVRLSVPSAESCFKLSIFIILCTNHHNNIRIFKLSL